MNNIYVSILLIQAVLACVLVGKTIFNEGNNRVIKFCLIMVGISSVVWGIGFAGIYSVDEVERAYLSRCIGKAGVYGYLIFGTYLICYLAKIPKSLHIPTHFIVFVGAFTYLFVIQREQATFEYSEEHGMSYTLHSTFEGNLSYVYNIVLAAIILIAVMYMYINLKQRRYKVLVMKLVGMEVVIIAGMILDTVLPMVGVSAVPGSSITQFYGYAIVVKALSELQKSEITVANISQFVYSSLSIPVFVYDDNYEMKLVNDSALKFLGKERYKTIKDKTLKEEYGIGSLFKKAGTTPVSFDFDADTVELYAKCTSNDADCMVKIDKIYDKYNDIVGYIVTVDDITEYIRLVNGLRDANKAKTTFLMNMSHTIRTPMDVIMGYTNVLLEQSPKSEQKEALTHILDASNELKNSVEQIFDASMLGTGAIKIIDDEYETIKLIKNLTKLAKNKVKNREADGDVISLKFNVDPEMPRVIKGDKGKVTSIINLFFEKAVEYTYQRKLEISFKHKILSPTEVDLIVKVKGIGRNDRLPELFRFFGSGINDNNNGFNSLDLSIVKGYLVLMRGNLYAEDDDDDENITLVVEVPQTIVKCEPMRNGSSKEENHTRNVKAIDYSEDIVDDVSDDIYNNRHEDVHEDIHDTTAMDDVQSEQQADILVVDDNLINLMVSKSLIERLGYSVDEVDNGNTAIERCKVHNYKAIFMDQMMPEMNGDEAVSIIRGLGGVYEKGGLCKIVSLTGNSEYIREEFEAAGYDEKLTKPLDTKRMQDILSSL